MPTSEEIDATNQVIKTRVFALGYMAYGQMLDIDFQHAQPMEFQKSWQDGWRQAARDSGASACVIEFGRQHTCAKCQPKAATKQERAWELYCKETKGDMHVVDYWSQLPMAVQDTYLARIELQADYPMKGRLALCSRGALGLLTKNHMQVVTYSDGKKGMAFVGIHLTDAFAPVGSPWSSRAPRLLEQAGTLADMLEAADCPIKAVEDWIDKKD